MKRPERKIRFTRRGKIICYIGILLFTLLLNGLAWGSSAFCDAYIARVFPIWVNTYGRLTGVFPFSVGEWMIIAGVMLSVAAVLSAVIYVIRRPAWVGRFYRLCAWILLLVWMVMTLNCVILYHASTFSENYFGEDEGVYPVEELLWVRNLVVERCDDCAGMVERDENGRIVYPGDISGDMVDQAILAMQKLGQTYSRLDGFYPRPKPLFFSDFLCQQYMEGYYFPFSLEANYNDVMYVTNLPEAMCHELAHLKGYIYEDEANFISYLACTQSDDIYFQYSGYLSVLNYLNNDIYQIAQSYPELYQRACEQVPLLAVQPQVKEDNVFVLPEDWDRINGNAVVDTEVVGEVTDAFLDTSLKIHGVFDGIVSYNRVVRLLLQYYRQTGEWVGD